MFLPYNITINEDGSYNFISEHNHTYLIYFSEYKLVDTEGNEHTAYNLGFTKNGDYMFKPYGDKHDGRIRATIMFIVNEFFKKNDHKALLYFCFGDDGYARHRNIVFNQWCQDLHTSVEKHNNAIIYENNIVYSSLVIVKDNPLKNLILSAFNRYLEEIRDK